ncbi:MAG: cysteine synthase A [Ruminococcaceae bacterium]|nr:cysteine synthase A [Oscillospiraceae bacterium]
MKIYSDISQLIGNTPLLCVSDYKGEKTGAEIYAKLEYLNPAGSIKDRAALSMIEAYEKEGKLKKGSVIIEPTSGNTGIGLAAVAASRGYKIILTMPDTMSIERRKLLKAYGAEIVLTKGSEGMTGAVLKAEEIAENIPDSIIAGQFINMANAMAHYNTTAPEIYADTDGEIDIFVAGVGTGGTLTGVGKYLKEKNKNIKIVAVEPDLSPLISKGIFGAHGIQGIGANFIPEILDTSLIDETVAVSVEESYSAARKLAKSKGILVGISSGAALYAATVLAENPENKGKKIVVILPDTGDRYLSTNLFE